MSYLFSGRVIRGDGYGKKIGFPTINIGRRSFLALKKKPSFGVYAGVVTLNAKKYKAGIVIGPIDRRELPKVEAHLIGYNGNAYGKIVIFEVERFIRKFKKFKNEKELITQIKKDLQKC